MAIMILADQGKVQFDDTLSKFCPEFPDYARTITIRHLLNHTSGLPDYEELLVGKEDANFFRSSKSPPAAHEFTAVETLQILSSQKALRFSPGEKFEYSNSGYVVLGQIIERVSGKRYAEFLQESIFDPLEMRDTLAVDERKQKVPRLALGYEKQKGKWRDITYSSLNLIYGEDNVVSTIDDLYKWDQALYTERMVRGATLEMAFTPGRTNDGKLIERRIEKEAHRSYMRVAVHAYTQEGIQAAIDAGADSIEHGDGMTDQQLKLMRDKGIFFDLTKTLYGDRLTKLMETKHTDIASAPNHARRLR
jgi:CubicO group peptidase (beta-lactamase class C family)